MNTPLGILAAGMVTAVGLDAPSACAALRGRLDGFCETRFLGPDGEWQIGAPVPLPRNWIGEKRLAHLAAGAIAELFEAVPGAAGRAALILCLPEEDRPGRPVRDAAALAARIAAIVEIPPRTRTQIVAHGRPSGLVALRQARRMLAEGAAEYVVVAGVDSYLTAPAIARYLADNRLLTPDNANGFLPGEAAAAILCAADGEAALSLAGLGLAREAAFLYNRQGEDGLDVPLRGDGMTAAYAQALGEAGVTLAGVEYRIADLIGEQYWFRQTALAALRLERGRTEFQDLWSPAESLGNIGAAVVPLMVGMALTAARKGYSGGSPVLIEASADDGACGAAVFHEGAA
ncbi:beta-ketoacyl synthase N-terminal-like domain-containing protein [Rhodovulum euryhalinum]|uniref:3-oxoacyl-[acyl-carrier-protein] synthase-1 n=1 Tax=Rhodovulum euryhalinum TaxID=35805 RepID=A0A4R2KIY5_9RHOB|nr:beta-ketoacyl synthase N-terminal-like domain-containing protein [Rhodovulum euryhalinum]TCO70539.1 3-oxoacyl-[acyl-carrier-protein] synthase-1 [Rhodovulum euryhalinum]